MLTFIGLGLYDEKDITLKGLEAIRDADVVYAEFYTSPLGAKTIEKMEEVLKKSVIIGIARAGSDKPIVKADYLDALKSYEFGEIPHVLVVPGELNFLEKEALVKIAQAPEAI